MQAGRLDRKITIEQRTDSADAYGANVPTWSTLASPWAEVIPLSGKEFYQADKINADRVARFRIYYIAGVSATMRINYDGLYWDIQHIAEIGRKEGLEILAEARPL